MDATCDLLKPVRNTVVVCKCGRWAYKSNTSKWHKSHIPVNAVTEPGTCSMCKKINK